MECEWCNKTEIGQGYFKLINLKPVRELDILQNKISTGDFSWGLEDNLCSGGKKKKKCFCTATTEYPQTSRGPTLFPKIDKKD